jgi:hypothetical protein
MKIKLNFAKIAWNPQIAWTECKQVEVEIPDIDFGSGEYQYKLIGAEYEGEPERSEEK